MVKIFVIVQMVNFRGGGATDHLTIAFVQYRISKQFKLSVCLQCRFL